MKFGKAQRRVIGAIVGILREIHATLSYIVDEQNTLPYSRERTIDEVDLLQLPRQHGILKVCSEDNVVEFRLQFLVHSLGISQRFVCLRHGAVAAKRAVRYNL